LADNPNVGPLLVGKGNADNMKKYLTYVKDFTENVYTNTDFIAETEAHAREIESAVKADPGRAIFADHQFEKELTASNGVWQKYNLLAFMKARGEEVKKQLAALDDGTFPRLDDKVPSEEPCQSWLSDKSPNKLSGNLVHGSNCPPALAAECCIIRENIATFTHKMQIVRSSISNTTTCPAELSIRHQGISAEANF